MNLQHHKPFSFDYNFDDYLYVCYYWQTYKFSSPLHGTNRRNDEFCYLIIDKKDWQRLQDDKIFERKELKTLHKTVSCCFLHIVVYQVSLQRSNSFHSSNGWHFLRQPFHQVLLFHSADKFRSNQVHLKRSMVRHAVGATLAGINQTSSDAKMVDTVSATRDFVEWLSQHPFFGSIRRHKYLDINISGHKYKWS